MLFVYRAVHLITLLRNGFLMKLSSVAWLVDTDSSRTSEISGFHLEPFILYSAKPMFACWAKCFATLKSSSVKGFLPMEQSV